MSWSGGNHVMHDLIESLHGRVPMPEYRRGIYEDMIRSLRGLDWDCRVEDFAGEDNALDQVLMQLFPSQYDDGFGRPDKAFHKHGCKCDQCLDWLVKNPL